MFNTNVIQEKWITFSFQVLKILFAKNFKHKNYNYELWKFPMIGNQWSMNFNR